MQQKLTKNTKVSDKLQFFVCAIRKNIRRIMAEDSERQSLIKNEVSSTTYNTNNEAAAAAAAAAGSNEGKLCAKINVHPNFLIGRIANVCVF